MTVKVLLSHHPETSMKLDGIAKMLYGIMPPGVQCFVLAVHPDRQFELTGVGDRAIAIKALRSAADALEAKADG